MFDQLSGRLKGVFDRLTGRGLLTEADVDAALREVRIALLEADVALPAIKRLTALVRERAVGDAVLKSITPGQQVIKVVHDALVEVLGDGDDLNLRTQPPAVILMAGLQGSGKTTTVGKLARLLKEQRKNVLVVSGDIYRPAAQDQLKTLCARVGVDFIDRVGDEHPVPLAVRALAEARKTGRDVLIVDTAGRLEVDDALMAELAQIRDAVQPIETLFVADGLTGQVAAEVAKTFHDKIGVTGIVLTRMDGDGRGGAALSVREVTGKPIKFLGTGEGLEGLSAFTPQRVAGRILGMGDVVALVEKMQSAVSEQEAADLQDKMMKGRFDLSDLRQQLKTMRKMGSLSSMMDLLPGMGRLKDKIDPSKLDDKVIVRQIAVIDSMTPAERRNPDLMNARRRLRVAKGAGVTVNDVNKLLKSYEQMAKMMKAMRSEGGLMKLLGGREGMAKMGGKLPFGK
jgi:signal recognition particle subunit SRP54